jgi:hypothetical protein
MPQKNVTQIRSDNIAACLTLAVSALNEVAAIFDTPFLKAISVTTLSLISSVQVANSS